MTDKTIINGVDVRGCEFFFSGKYKFCSAHRNIERVDDQYIDFTGKCASHRNCYYKRLRREKPDILELTEKLIKSDEEMKSLQMYSDAITKRSELAEECLEDWKKQYQLLEEKLKQIAQLAEKNSNTNVNDFENTYIGMINYLKANNEQINQIAQGEQ